MLNMPSFCPACFWIRFHMRDKMPFQIPMPGIFGSIDVYTKNIIHEALADGRTRPPWLGFLGNVVDYVPKLHHSWYYYQDEATGITLTGTPDDIFRLADGSYTIVDYKTARASETQADLFALYEVQLNVYAFIARNLDDPLRPVASACLVYFEPQTEVDDATVDRRVNDTGFQIHFVPKVKPVALRGDAWVRDLLARAGDCYSLPACPDHQPGCKEERAMAQLAGLAASRGKA
jgi:hypothetical protein